MRAITPAIDPAKPVYMAGFGNNRVATGVRDELYSRCLAMQSGGDPVVVCAVDSIGLFFDDVEKIRARVRGQWKRGRVAVIVAATHSHQTPDTMGLWGPREGVSGIDEAYNALVIQRTADAAVAALRSMKGARAFTARTHPPELDSFIDDDRPPKKHDSELLVLRLTRGDGRGIATVINWANHPEALGSKNTLLTPDFPAELVRDTESRLGGVTLFINGALGGMQSPLGAKVIDPRTREEAPPESWRHAEVIGNEVADITLRALDGARRQKVGRVGYRETMVRLPNSNAGFRAAAAAGVFRGRKAFQSDGSTMAPVGLLRIEDGKRVVLEAVTIPGELYPELSVGGILRDPGADYPNAPVETPVKQILTADYRMLFGITNDEIGYIIPKAEWDEKPPYLQGAAKPWYGEVNSLGPETAPLLIEAVKSLASQR